MVQAGNSRAQVVKNIPKGDECETDAGKVVTDSEFWKGNPKARDVKRFMCPLEVSDTQEADTYKRFVAWVFLAPADLAGLPLVSMLITTILGYFLTMHPLSILLLGTPAGLHGVQILTVALMAFIPLVLAGPIAQPLKTLMPDSNVHTESARS